MAMDDAACNGHLDVVKWLHEHRREGCTTDAMDFAAFHGHLDVLRWLHKHRREGCTQDALELAARMDHLYVVQWLLQHRTEGDLKEAILSAALFGSVYTFHWFVANYTDILSEIEFSRATSPPFDKNSLYVLYLMIKHNCHHVCVDVERVGNSILLPYE